MLSCCKYLHNINHLITKSSIVIRYCCPILSPTINIYYNFILKYALNINRFKIENHSKTFLYQKTSIYFFVKKMAHSHKKIARTLPFALMRLLKVPHNKNVQKIFANSARIQRVSFVRMRLYTPLSSAINDKKAGCYYNNL